MQQQLMKKLLPATHLAFISPFHRLFSTSVFLAEDPPIKSPFAMEYLVKSCGLSREKATKASNYIPQLKSNSKADSVLQFMRQIGLSDTDVKRTVTIDPRILCSDLEKTIKPKVMKIQDIGFSPSQVAQLISFNPLLFRSRYSSLQNTIEFLLPILGSFEGIVSASKRSTRLLTASVENGVKPNISYLEEHCGVSPSQIAKTIQTEPRLFTVTPKKFKDLVQRAEELGLPRGSGLFVYALLMVYRHTPSSLDEKINNLKNLGFSKSESELMIKKLPMLISNSCERIQRSFEFLTKEAGLDLQSIAFHPIVFSFSLEQRLRPRHYVLESLKSKGLGENLRFFSVMNLSEEGFQNKVVKPYKDLIPDIVEAYKGKP